jgi:hypothetical protein
METRSCIRKRLTEILSKTKIMTSPKAAKPEVRMSLVDAIHHRRSVRNYTPAARVLFRRREHPQ